MRILLVSHDFLPGHPSGTEIYTWQLGVALKALGHEVHVFTTEKDVGRENLRVDLREYGGLPVHELVNNLFYNDFRETWDYPPAARSFGLFLDDLKPDVVHFMHLLYLSVGCVEEAHQRGLPVVFTLHDYWLQCPRFGQRVHADTSVCHRIEFQRCGECLTQFKYRQTRSERATAKLIAKVHARTGLDLSRAARRAADAFRRRAPPSSPALERPRAAAEPERAAALQGAVGQRDRELRARLLPIVDRFVAPSRFLRDSFLEWGIPAAQVRHARAGIDVKPFHGFVRRSSVKTRIAFIGTLAPHKGPHLLLTAWSRLAPAQRDRGTLTIYGPKAHNPAYVAQLEHAAAASGAVLAGGLDRGAVVGALAEVDLLVVPSVWYENSPLIILEALATRTPLAVTDLGGMAELVEPGVSGFRFPLGDADGLAAILARVLDDPRLLSELYPEHYAVKSIEADATELLELYAEVRRERGRA